jgi:hypothetical protein
LSPSTSHAAFFVDSCGNVSDTIVFWTQDSAFAVDTTYLWTAKPALLGISPFNSGYVGDRIKIYGPEIKDTGSLTFHGKICVLDSVNNDTIYAVVPDTAFGAHDFIWVDPYGKKDTIEFTLLEEVVIPQFNLTTSYTGSGSVSPEGTTAQDSGAEVNISATSGTGYDFSVWRILSGSATIADTTDSTTTVTISSNASVQAVFNPKLYKVKLVGDRHVRLTFKQ